MKAAQGILTGRGGTDITCSSSCPWYGCMLRIRMLVKSSMDEENKTPSLAARNIHEGDVISFDGSTGNIYDGAIPTVDATILDILEE